MNRFARFFEWSTLFSDAFVLFLIVLLSYWHVVRINLRIRRVILGFSWILVGVLTLWPYGVSYQSEGVFFRVLAHDLFFAGFCLILLCLVRVIYLACFQSVDALVCVWSLYWVSALLLRAHHLSVHVFLWPLMFVLLFRLLDLLKNLLNNQTAVPVYPKNPYLGRLFFLFMLGLFWLVLALSVCVGSLEYSWLMATHTLWSRYLLLAYLLLCVAMLICAAFFMRVDYKKWPILGARPHWALFAWPLLCGVSLVRIGITTLKPVQNWLFWILI